MKKYLNLFIQISSYKTTRKEPKCICHNGGDLYPCHPPSKTPRKCKKYIKIFKKATKKKNEKGVDRKTRRKPPHYSRRPKNVVNSKK